MTLAWVTSMYGQAVTDKVAVNLEIQQWTEGAEYDPFAEIYGLTGPTNATEGHNH